MIEEQTKAPVFEQWAIVELMGHRRLAGLVTEAELFGTALLRVDVYEGDAEAPSATQFYGGSSIYCLTPTSETIARRVAAQNKPAPVQRWELPALQSPQPPRARDDDDDDDGDDGYEDGETEDAGSDRYWERER